LLVVEVEEEILDRMWVQVVEAQEVMLVDLTHLPQEQKL
jgi:hypothetical protein